MAKTHLTLSERIIIEGKLNNGESFAEIARAVGKDRSTISREVQNHSVEKRKRTFNKGFNDCRNRYKCPVSCACGNDRCNRKACADCVRHCGRNCGSYVQEVCRKLLAVPYVCNGCKNTSRCTLARAYYEACAADEKYRSELKNSRRGVNLTKNEADRLQTLIKPLVDRGQSLQAINMTNAEQIGRSTKTLYTYVNSGVFPQIKNIDLPRKVVYRPRKKKVDHSYKKDRGYKEGRRKEDFDLFLKEHPQIRVAEMDTVEGPRIERRCLLTIQMLDCSVQLGFLRECNSSETVLASMDCLKRRLGSDDFKRLFPVILTDNGGEFSNPEAIETDGRGEILTRVFYCHPLASWEKGDCENNHALIRRILPKGATMSGLTQEKVDLMMNHINNYPRPQYNGKSAYEMFVFLHGIELAEKLGLEHIPTDAVTLKPILIK